MALKEKRDRKSDLFRPWDEESATIPSTSASNITQSSRSYQDFTQQSKSHKRERSFPRIGSYHHRPTQECESLGSSTSTKSSTETSPSSTFLPIPVTFNPSASLTPTYPTFPSVQMPYQVPSLDPLLNTGHINFFASRSLFGSYLGPPDLPRISEESNNTKKSQSPRKKRPKRFQCPHCHVSFSNNGQLSGHIRTHTGERPFACDHPNCGKTFTRNEELTRHKRIHTGLRPFACPTCGKRFGRKDHLKKHQRTHDRKLHHFSLPAAAAAAAAAAASFATSGTFFHPANSLL